MEGQCRKYLRKWSTSPPTSDLVIEVRNDDQSATYVVHCVPSDFPEVTILRKEPGVSEGLLLVAPRYTNSQYIAMLDNNGVPRFHRRIGQRASDFKWHSRHRVYSYVQGIGRNSYDQNDYVIVILDERFDEIHRARTVNLNHTDGHDFLITDEGNYLLLSYNSVRRDLSAYPDDDGTFTYSTAELSRDSVIQEVSPQGELLADWNSWDHMKISDCLQHRYPGRLCAYQFTAHRGWRHRRLVSRLLASTEDRLAVRRCDLAVGRNRPEGA